MNVSTSMNTEKNSSESLYSRTVAQQFSGIETADGDGVKLTRIIGSPYLNMLDPFLLLDCFESDNADDYMGGFPTHPHRGFETVTYLLNGRMRHKDNTGHEGVIEPGGVQWMTAAKGILHSEMPEQEDGLLKGFQLWVNLPASAKMSEPAYQEYPPESTPLERRDNGTEVRVIAGQTNQGTTGPVVNNYTNPTYLDVSLPANTTFEQTLPAQHNAFIYVIEGNVSILHTEDDAAERQTNTLTAKNLGVLTKGDQILLHSGDNGARLLLIAGQPLHEPVARGGPFVMNTRAEVLQAFEDFNDGSF
ncbi:redox-sensitive bicupin YhaK (pirin superfamily) [Psychrobacter sp. PL15]|uniref:pirin family protein n=1 Tax=unclassified Psychrobacter TaxID=196806 RepID=UPI002DFF180D|nr:redox-sensitive bicupin YhaK (pirin superfamily) [Psychrobacter sp. PL15]